MARLFATESFGFRARALYGVYAVTVSVGICLVLYCRAVGVLSRAAAGEAGSEAWLWLGMLAAELWFALCWIVAQSVRWPRPVRRRAFRDRLAARLGDKLPCVDIFVCTADPRSEPPIMVVSVVLSVMAYSYPANKLSVYLSDDGCSALTFYALWEASRFAKLWLPFCRRHSIEPRSPAAYFSETDAKLRAGALCSAEEWSLVKESYKEMTERIDSAVMLAKVPEEIKAMHKGFYEWDSSEVTSQNHQPIVQVLIDGKDRSVVDHRGSMPPTLVYMAREKRPHYHHNFKAGAMNTLIRVSSVISNSPIILNVDCDVYSNNSNSIRDALCFFMDEEMGHKVGFVQYPQNYTNLTKNDIYGNSLNVINEVELCGMDGVGGPAYIGTGCFHRRDVLCGRSFTEDYKHDWDDTGITAAKPQERIDEIEEQAKSVASCAYEASNTQWGREMGVKYGCPVEDVITGLAIQCRGWASVYFNPQRKAFLGLAPTTLAQTLLQHRRFGEGNFSILLSRYCSVLFGHGKIELPLQLGYCIYGLWAPSSLPTLYYVIVPSLGLLKGIPLFPEITSPWSIPFVYVSAATYMYSLYEALSSGVTVRGWWNGQRMWIIKRTTSYLFAMIDTVSRLLGLSAMAFAITPKVTDEDQSRRYGQELMEFGDSSTSPELVIVAATALLSLVCLAGGLSWVLASGCGSTSCLSAFCLQIVLCGALAAVNVPVYEAMLLRKDRGRVAFRVSVAACFGLVLPACLIWVNVF